MINEHASSKARSWLFKLVAWGQVLPLIFSYCILMYFFVLTSFPTLVLRQGFSLSKTDKTYIDSLWVTYLPKRMRSEVVPVTNMYTDGFSESDILKQKQAFTRELKLVYNLLNAGVKILAGTDAASSLCFPGYSLHQELYLMVEAGLSPYEALKTATVNPAQFLQKNKELGTIKRGKLADLFLS